MMFISYSRSNPAEAKMLVSALQAEGVECWLDESNIPVGEAFVAQLGTALQRCRFFLLLDTNESRTSYWVARERQTALRYRRQRRLHALLRAYSADCAESNDSCWDLSASLDQGGIARIRTFLAEQFDAAEPMESDHVRGDVQLLSDRGLGQPRNWAGRQDALRSLDDWWSGAHPAIWLQGLGGIGKTGLIQTWVAALSYLGYAAPVHAAVLYVAGSEIGLADIERHLRESHMDDDSVVRLLVIDGHDEARDTDQVEEAAMRWTLVGGRVIITSRQHLPASLARQFATLELAATDRRDSIALLNQLGVTGPECPQLADAVDCHPLALLIMGNHARTHSLTAADALSHIARTNEQPERASASIRTVLEDSIRSVGANARSFLGVLCRDSEQATLNLGAHLPAVAELARASLIQVDSLENPVKVSIHPLVRNLVLETTLTQS